MSARVPLILDVDTGIDDAAAIALAVHSPDAELLSISTVAGNTTIENATRNTLDVLDLLGASAIPVYRGASRPLVRELFMAAYAHGNNGVGGAELPKSKHPVGDLRGPASIVHHAHTRPGEVTLVCLGPLTNLAIALNVEPELPRLLKGLVVMGGAFWTPGNIKPLRHAEFNLYVDPEAAKQAFDADFQHFYAVGLDVTHEAPISADVWNLILASDSAPASIIQALYRSRLEHPERGTAYIHDAMAVAAALDPEFISWAPHAVEIQIDETYRGQSRLADGNRVLVAREVDALAFMTRFYDRLGIQQRAAGA
ncbi:MAG: nucleoside hydrolase [Thermomicrobiales bacterium]|nr:nucleoside hydrolase [Thermomicrobiales bacterium]